MNGAVLQDTSDRPLFARWVGYANLWVGLLWISVAVFVAWFVIMFATMRPAVKAVTA